jgi:hypothetical protein
MPKTIRSKPYVGVTKKGERIYFRSVTTPEPHEYRQGYQFAYVIGPFRTKAGAIFMRDFGRGNPHCRCVAEAERLAKVA